MLKKISDLGKILNKAERKMIFGGNLPGPVGETEDCLESSEIDCILNTGPTTCRMNEVCVSTGGTLVGICVCDGSNQPLGNFPF